MNQCKTISIDGIDYVRKDSLSAEPKPGEAMRIVVADRGLTFVGYCEIPVNEADARFVTIHDARCVIAWGTTGHLAELAEGPTKSTRLGAKRTVRVAYDQIVAVYECGSGWK